MFVRRPVATDMGEVYREQMRDELALQQILKPNSLVNDLAGYDRRVPSPEAAIGTYASGSSPDQTSRSAVTSQTVKQSGSLLTDNDLRNPIETVGYEEPVNSTIESSSNAFRPRSENNLQSVQTEPAKPLETREFKMQPSNDVPINSELENAMPPPDIATQGTKATIKDVDPTSRKIEGFSPTAPVRPGNLQGAIKQSAKFSVRVEPAPEPELISADEDINSSQPVDPFGADQPTQSRITDSVPVVRLGDNQFAPRVPKKTPTADLAETDSAFQTDSNEFKVGRDAISQDSNAFEQKTAPFAESNGPGTSSRTGNPDTLETVPDKPLLHGEMDDNELRIASAKSRGVWQVGTDESLWHISQLVYEDGRLFRALYEVNKNQILDPNVLNPGTEIRTPPLNELLSRWADFVPEDLRSETISDFVYHTQNGDTLFNVARQKLGQASRFDELLKLNASKLPLDANHLTPLPEGMRLDLPRQ